MSGSELLQEAWKFITGGAAVGLIGAILKWKSSKAVTMESIVQRLDKEREEYKTELEDLKQSFKDIQLTLLYIKSAHYSSPHASWVKNKNGVMMSLNDAYEDNFLKPRGLSKFNYLAYKDKDVWPDSIAEEYAKNDAYVINHKVEWRGYETVIIGDKVTKWRISKWPIWDDMKREVQGVAGVAFPDKWV